MGDYAGLGSAVALALAAYASPAAAQAASDSAEPETQSTKDGLASEGLSEIVVVARKRSESLQQTPVAVSAVSADDLAARGSNSISSVADIAPNVTFNSTASNSGSSNAAVIFIRGIGQSDFYPQVDPGVGVYLDGVYISRSTGAVLDLVDVQQVEVLRGPQGTLYGKNTIGGAINITTRAPEDHLGGYIEVTGGRYDRIDAKARLDLPVTDTFRTAFSFATLNRDGYIKLLKLDGTPSGTAYGNVSALAARFAATWEAAAGLTFDFSADWTRRREESAGATLLKINPNGVSEIVHNTLIAPSLVPTLGQFAYYNDQYITGDPYKAYGDPALSKSNLDLWGVALTTRYEITPDIELKSITAFRKSKSDLNLDGDASPLTILQPATLIDQKQVSQEFNLSGKSLSDRLNWIIGAYWMNEKVFFDAPVDVAFVSTDNTARLTNKSLAGFGQATYKVTDALGLTVGLRWTQDKKSNDARVIATRLIDPGTLTYVPTPLPLLIDNPHRTFEKWTPAATLDYRFTPNVFGYVTYSQGFKSGGFSQRIAYPRADAPSFDPETVKSYEAGIKLELFDRRLRWNSAAFYTDYSNLQVIVFNQGEPLTQNGGKARIKGLETEMTAEPTPGLNLTFSAGYLDGAYKRVNPATLIPDGAKLAYTSKWTLSGSIAYDFEIGGSSKITPRLDWAYRSTTYFDALNSPEIRQPGYHLLNASVRWSNDDWAVSAGITNLTDKRYLIGGYAEFPVTGFATATYARPREWYLTVRRNF